MNPDFLTRLALKPPPPLLSGRRTRFCVWQNRSDGRRKKQFGLTKVSARATCNSSRRFRLSLPLFEYNGTEVYSNYNTHLVYFTLNTGGKVLSTGNIQYSWGLDDYSPIDNSTGIRIHPVYTNHNAQKLAENTFGCLINGVCQ